MTQPTVSGGAVINPLDNPELFDVVLLGGVQAPGIVSAESIESFKKAHEWDVKKGKGSTGGTTTFVQRPPTKGTLEFWLWEPEHWTEWANFLPLLKYDPTKKAPQAVDLYHPSLAEIDLTAVVTESVGAVYKIGPGWYARKIDFLEFFPPPNASAVGTPTTATTTNPSGTTGVAPGNAPTSADDQYQQQINTLIQQAQAP